jgi:hypothetical protein
MQAIAPLAGLGRVAATVLIWPPDSATTSRRRSKNQKIPHDIRATLSAVVPDPSYVCAVLESFHPDWLMTPCTAPV